MKWSIQSRCLCSLLLILWTCLPFQAQAVGVTLLYEEVPLSLEMRKEIAADLLERVSVIERWVPTLSPTELEWLEREQREIDPTDDSQYAPLHGWGLPVLGASEVLVVD